MEAPIFDKINSFRNPGRTSDVGRAIAPQDPKIRTDEPSPHVATYNVLYWSLRMLEWSNNLKFPLSVQCRKTRGGVHSSRSCASTTVSSTWWMSCSLDEQLRRETVIDWVLLSLCIHHSWFDIQRPYETHANTPAIHCFISQCCASTYVITCPLNRDLNSKLTQCWTVFLQRRQSRIKRQLQW